MARPSDAGSTGASALGYLKSHDSIIHVRFELAPTKEDASETIGVERPDRKQRKAAQRLRKAQSEQGVKEVHLRLHQDLGTLSREKGDTGTSPNLERVVDEQAAFSGEAGA